ncbi:flagellar biosynthesis anti-sigma factor FlgM [Aliidiomarina indica]|uniref:flagellar biosynthesis anti-sigma factor FlgM n=1 Tax=Aliidiomarina indica TaxID=2749147 RepID=UPI001E616932|nr:flagellar biosynthesis anti-sigma factor FlgM [Aliidiomarina indica]
MKVNGIQSLPLTNQTDQGKQAGKSGATDKAASASTPGAVTHLSQTLDNTSQDIDMARVEELREAIRDGKLDIRADKIADSLIDSVREMLDN